LATLTRLVLRLLESDMSPLLVRHPPPIMALTLPVVRRLRSDEPPAAPGRPAQRLELGSAGPAMQR
jgi:hypothetical protein